jgi:hypothetical protein
MVSMMYWSSHSCLAFHVAQVQETQAEPPRLARIGQPDQQIGDLFILSP